MSEFDPQAFLKQLTHGAGVYLMIGAEEEVLYVGKARDLKNRVSTYFSKSAVSPRIAAMVAQVERVDVNVTHTEDEALILEATLIKRHRPRYNVLLRDDKSYPYVHLSTQHPFPRLSFYRGARSVKGRLFGPYPSAGAVRESLASLQKVFRLRSCNDTFFSNRSRPCLQYQIKRCTAPCVGYISKEEYARDVADAAKLLAGRNEALIKQLVGDMEDASARLDFETAARLREKIASLRRLQAQGLGNQGDLDIVCATIEGGVAAVVVVTVRGGLNLGHRSFFPNAPAYTAVADVMAAFISQYYLDRRPPPELLVDPLPADDVLLADSLSRRGGRRVHFRPRVRGERRRWLDNARATLAQTLYARLASRAGVEKRLAALAEALGLEAPPMQMACFDISHTRGERAVASCVVFEAGAPNKSAYRRFNIDGIEPGDDYAAMRAALTRRFKRIKTGEAPLPDLLLIDGGKGQLAVAGETLDELGITGVQLLGVAKGAARKPGLEQLFLPEYSTPLILPADSPALHLIQQIRDEAHRFAIAAHRGQRGKARRGSMLDAVEGLGPKRRKQLLRTFGGPREVARAGVAELARVEGISAKMAQRIYDYFHETDTA